jgi:hypothetical protein
MSRRPSSQSRRPWHRGSIFGPGRRGKLDGNQRARWRYLVSCHARARRISAYGEWALDTLLKHLTRDGRCTPSHARLAADADVSVSTVEQALKDAKRLGLLDWDRRLVRSSWRAEQTSNAYELLLPGSAPAVAPHLPVNLESYHTGSLTVAAAPAVSIGLPPGWEARVAAKIAAEKQQRRARLL